MNLHKTAAGAVLAFGLMVSACSEPEQTQQAPAPLPVQIQTVELTQIDNVISLSGRARASVEAEIRPEVSGLITRQLFKEGQSIQQGDPLYKIEDATYSAAVASARASLERAEAAAQVAADTEARYKRLVDIRAVSQQDYEQAVSAARQAAADISMQEAALRRAQIDFRKTTVRSPIDGQIGRSEVTVGALVTANQAPRLARVLQLDPINVDLTVPSLRVIEFQRQVDSGEIDVSEDSTIPVQIVLENGQRHAQLGQLAFAEVSVDEGAGTVTMRATVPNPDGKLLPGMYLKAELTAGQFDNVVTVPQSAVSRNPRGDATVFVMTEDNIVEQRIIETSDNLNDTWIVSDGLSEKDRVITSHIQILRPGMPVSPQAGGN